MYAPLAGNEPGLVAYYRMDDGAGGVLHDATPNSNHGLLVNGPTWMPATDRNVAVTMSATDITFTGATLSALVQPHNQPTVAWFEWGTNATYDQRTAESDAGSGTNNLLVQASLSNLMAGTIYHYRLVSSNSLGLVCYGADSYFTTIGSRNVNFGLGLQYGTNATRPAVAINLSNDIVEFHATGTRLAYRIGQPNQATVNWGSSSNYTSGQNPAIAVNNSGIVVAMHQDTTLKCNVGNLSGGSITWQTIADSGDGVFPAIAINNDNVVVAVYQAASGAGVALWCRIGTVNGNAIVWQDPATYDVGETPAIALNNAGQVMAVHESANKLYYRVGQLSGTSTILWANSWYYDDGKHPSVAVTDDGYVIEVHTSINQQDLTSRVGRINNDRIDWLGPSERFDAGSAPSVACNGQLAIQVHEITNGLDLAFSSSLLTDRSSWMQHRLAALYDTPLNRLVLPASHDAAMYNVDLDNSQLSANWNIDVHNWCNTGLHFSYNVTPAVLRSQLVYALDNDNDCVNKITQSQADDNIPAVQTFTSLARPLANALALTQDKTIYEQLSLGIRTFDLRPKLQDGLSYFHHSTGANISYTNSGCRSFDFVSIHWLDLCYECVLTISEISANGPPLQQVLNDVRRFMNQGHRELVILNFSHYLNKTTGQTNQVFGDFQYRQLIGNITNSLGRWLFTSLPAGKQRLSEVNLGQFLAYQGTVLVLCDNTADNLCTNNPPGIWSLDDLPFGPCPDPEKGTSAGTDNYSVMVADQFAKYVTNDFRCGATMLPSDMFSLTWILAV